VYYSARLEFAGREPCKAFTALGRVADDEIFQVRTSGGFSPYRRRMVYQPVHDAPIRPLLAYLSFIPDQRRWGARLRFGHLEISASDFAVIAAAMGAEP
jgi:hypothetical protein